MTGSISIAEAPTVGIGKLILENRFYVPTHQRDYKWDRDRVQQFIDDLFDALDRDDDFYFIGLMVFMRGEDGRLRVLDGQQRLATAIILFSALRSWFGATQSDADTAKDLQRDFIGRQEYGTTSQEPKLTLNIHNDERFQRYVTGGSPIETIRAEHKTTGKTQSNYLMLDAILTCHQRIAEKAKNGNGSVSDYFVRLIKFMRDNLIVVRLTVPNEANAFRVFETLNDRGMDLSAVDLVKNHLFGLVYNPKKPDQLTQIEHRWSQIIQTLQNFRQEDFLKVFWTARYGLVQLDSIFEDVKKRNKTSEQAISLSMDLLEAAEHYVALDDADDAVWKPFNEKVRRYVRELKILGSKLVRPAIMSGLKRLTPAEFERLLWLLQVVVVRWQLIGEGRTGTIERLCGRLAVNIWDGDVTKATEASAVVAELLTSDEEFQSRFRQQSDLAKQKAVYLLKRIEEREQSENTGVAGSGLSPSQSLSLEHILPQSPSEEWAVVIEDDPKIVEECVERIGNYCLLPEPPNRDLGRAGFQKKQRLYAESNIDSTQRVSEAPTWDRHSIESRQAWLASRAAAIWRFQ